MERDKTLMVLAVVVLPHLGVAYAHASAHAVARVDLAPAALVFVLVVIGVGPIAGLTWAIRDSRRGARLVGATMVASLLFGLVDHVLVPGADPVLGFARGFRPARKLA